MRTLTSCLGHSLRAALVAFSLLSSIAVFTPTAHAQALSSERVCSDTPPSDAITDASTLTVEVQPSSEWRPPGAEVKLTISAPNPKDLEGLALKACFRRLDVRGKEQYTSYDPVHILSWSSDRTTLNIGVKVPVLSDPDDHRGWFEVYVLSRIRRLFTESEVVPTAELRLIGNGSNLKAPLDVVVTIGVTQVVGAIITTFLIEVWALWMLRRFATRSNIPRTNFLLAVISTPQGYASLSQFQIMTWTFVVGASAVYVMCLSGNLIDIPNQMLILLGITGVSVIGGKLKAVDSPTANSVTSIVTSKTSVESVATSKASAGLPPSDVDPDVEPANGASGAAPNDSSTTVKVVQDTTKSLQIGRPVRTPRWEDLVIDPRTGVDIDVTRIQMFFFTVVSALFVSLKVLAGYSIPEIPDGFLWLMGLSNGVYLTNKFIPDPSSKPSRSLV